MGLGVGGSAAAPPGADYLMAVGVNAGGNKLDAFLRRTLDWRVRLAADGSATATASLTLHNEVSVAGLPSYIVGPYDARFRKGVNEQIQTLYVAGGYGFTKASLDGRQVSAEAQTDFGGLALTQSVGVAAGDSATLDQVPGIVQSVLTGNFKPVAITKLVTFGLDAHVDFEIGAYGSDDSVRANLVDIARRRAAEKYHTTFDQRATVLIGDTPSDIEAGRDAGAFVIAVASGRSSMDELRAAEAEVVVPDLTDTDGLLQLVVTAAQ